MQGLFLKVVRRRILGRVYMFLAWRAQYANVIEIKEGVVLGYQMCQQNIQLNTNTQFHIH